MVDSAPAARSEPAAHNRSEQYLEAVLDLLPLALVDTSLDLDARLQELADQIRARLSADAVVILLIDPETHMLSVRARAISDEALRQKWFDRYREPWPADWGIVGWVAQTGRTALVSDIRSDPRGSERKRETPECVIAAPLLLRGQPIGVIRVSALEADRYQASDQRLLEALAQATAIAVENARLAEALQHRTDELERRVEALHTLEESGSLVLESIDPRRVVELMLDKAIAAGSFEVGIVYLRDGSRLDPVASYGLQHLEEFEAHTRSGDAARGRAMSRINASRDPIIIDDVASFGGLRTLAREDVRSVILVPIHVGGEVLGAINLGVRSQRVFSPALVELLGAMGSQFGFALQKAKLFDEARQREERLRQSQKMEAIGMLAGGIAHDFNNLLTVILGFSDLLSANPDDPGRIRWAKEIGLASEKAAELTSQLLAFSRRQVLQPKLLNLNSVVSDMESLLRRIIGEDIELATNLDPDLGSIRADPSQLSQVILNLAANARDAMPTGGRLIIETSNVEIDPSYTERHNMPRAGHHVLLAVSDTGIGMDAVVQAHLFEPFFTTKPQGKGTGLGLAMVYGVVKQSEGDVWVYSEHGLGTTFKIYLPRSEAIADAPRRPPPDGETLRADSGTETVLVVEDEPGVRALACAALGSHGYHVLEASQGSDALRLCTQYSGAIDIVVTDLVMPGMSGRELAAELAHVRPSTSVLYMSGYTDDVAIRHGLVGPTFAYIQKPFTPAALAQKVRDVLQARTTG